MPRDRIPKTHRAKRTPAEKKAAAKVSRTRMKAKKAAELAAFRRDVWGDEAKEGKL